jgi:hypothetical protein
VPPSGTRALAETSGDATSDRFPLAIYDDVVAKDGDPEGDRFEVLLNGHVLFSATDDSFRQDGKVGLWTNLPLGLGLLDVAALQRRHRAHRVLRLILDPRHGPSLARRSGRIPAPME